MSKEHPRLKLGKTAAFVKTRLKLLSRENETWEADFRALPRPAVQTDTHYLGLVVARPKGDPLVYLPVEYTPNVNDLADLLSQAMRRPLSGSARRPQHVHFRGNPRWRELFRHLNELGIETSIQDDLPKVEEAYEEFLRQMRKASPGLFVTLSQGQTQCEEIFPAVAQWVNGGYGHIEIGDQEGFGLITRALDYGGLVFENNKARTLTEALTALEKGLTKCFAEQGIEIEGR